MKEPEHEDQHAPLSYHGAGRIVWLVFLLIIVWVSLRALQPVILLFALVFLIAMVLNPIVVWLHKYRIPRFVSVILLMLVLLVHLEGLRQVIVRAALHRLDGDFFGTVGRHHDDQGRILARFELPKKVEPAFFRHFNVEEQ